MYAAKRFKSKYDPATFFARLKSYCQLDDNPVITLSTNTMGDVYTVSLTTKGVFAPQSGLPLYGDLFHNRMKVNIAKDKVDGKAKIIYTIARSGFRVGYIALGILFVFIQIIFLWKFINLITGVINIVVFALIYFWYRKIFKQQSEELIKAIDFANGKYS